MDSTFRLSPVILLAAVVSGTGAFQVESSDKRRVSEVGSDIRLHCALWPPLALRGMRVHWFRSYFYQTVFMLESGKEDRDRQKEQYRGRASLPGRVEAGDLTLELRNVSLSDTDTYHCLVENISSKRYEEAVTELVVIGSGSVPVLAVSQEGSAIVVSYVTSDWFPRPEMCWTLDGEPADTTEEIHNQSDGLFRLQSRVLLRGGGAGPLYGVARHPVTGKEMGINVIFAADMFPRVSPWLYAFLFVSGTLAIGAVWMIYDIRRQRTQRERLQEKADVLSSEVDWRKAVMSPEYITLSPETAHPDLSVSDDFLTLFNRPPPATARPCDARFETERCCLGLPAFTSGCHYWEVELGDGLEWAVGVASYQVQRKGHAYMFRPQEHIWCISRFMETIKALDTQESTLVVEGGALQMVGVYLNLSGPREVIFYDPRNWDILYTFSNVGQGRESILPFFWLGRHGGELKLKSKNERSH